MSITDHDHHLASSSNRMCFSRVMDGRSSNGGGAQEAVAGTVLTTYLTFLEHKIGHLRGILCSTPPPRQKQQQQIVSAELSCIIVQLISVSKSLVAGTGTGEGEEADDVDARSPPLPLMLNPAHGMGSDYSDDHDGHHRNVDGEGEEEEERVSSAPPPSGSYEVIQIDREEILAPHVHFCKVCGKGFKRDANLRMHMRGHGDEYKTAAALAKPPPPPFSSSTSGSRDAQAPTETAAAAAGRRCYYSCPYAGCKRNKEHRDFQPLKTAVCVKNHYRRSHCDKSHTCRRCNVKKFSVLADLRTHEKHCGRDCWVCSCGTSFSRKEKLFAHVAVFDGHTPALPPDETATATATEASFGGNAMPVSGQQLLPAGGEAVSMDQCFSDSMFMLDDFISCSDIIKGSSMDDERGFLSPMGLDSCNFDGFDLFGAPAIDFDF